jgi:protein-disulfide isomerase
LALAQAADDLSGLRKDIDALKEGQAALLRELQQIKSLLSASPPAPRAGPAPEAVLTVAAARRRAARTPRSPSSSSRTTSDRSAPGNVRETYSQIERDYIQTGALRYVVRDLPLESIHKEAFKAAEATHCARDQGKYWEMHGRLFANQRQLGRDDLTRHAQALGLDKGAFERCLESGKHADAIARTSPKLSGSRSPARRPSSSAWSDPTTPR